MLSPYKYFKYHKHYSHKPANKISNAYLLFFYLKYFLFGNYYWVRIANLDWRKWRI